MPETLVLRFNSSPDEPLTWLVVDSTGTRIGQVTTGSLAEVKPQAEQRLLTVLLPANDCLVSHSDLPIRNTAKLLQALPYSFEDQLIGSVDDAHFAFGQRNGSNHFPVAIINRNQMDQYLARLAEHNLNVQRIYPGDAALPLTENGCTVLVEKQEAVIRKSNGDAVTVDHGSLVFALQLAQKSLGKSTDEALPMPITVYIDDDSGDASEAVIAQVHEAFPQTEFRRLPHGALSKLAVEALDPSLPNLLQGRYAPATNFEKSFAPWRQAAFVAGLLLAVIIGYKAVELKTMKTRLAEAHSAMLQLAKDTLPQEQRITDPVRLFRQRLNLTGGGGTEGSEFLDFLDVVSGAATNDVVLSLNRLNYRPGNLDIEVEATDVQVLDRFTNKISGLETWSASLASTKPTGDKVQGRVTIQRKVP